VEQEAIELRGALSSISKIFEEACTCNTYLKWEYDERHKQTKASLAGADLAQVTGERDASMANIQKRTTTNLKRPLAVAHGWKHSSRMLEIEGMKRRLKLELDEAAAREDCLVQNLGDLF
jgi:hypothetical protein